MLQIPIPRKVFYPVLVIGMFGFLSFYARRVLFQPMRYPQGYWAEQARFHAADVWLQAKDGVRIHGWYVESPGARLNTLFLHGNAGNLTHRGPHLDEIAAAGSSVLIIDYRGYGRSEGKPDEDGLYADAEAGYECLWAKGKPVVLHGESLGTAVAVNLASRRPAAGLVLEAPFTSARAVAHKVLPYLGPLLVSGFDSLSRIRQVRTPLLLIHGDQDEVLSFEFGRELFAAAPGRKTFWPVHGAGHNDIVGTAGPQYRDHLREFYRGL